MDAEAVVLSEIESGVRAGLPKLTPQLRNWAEAHLVEPRPIRAAVDPEGLAHVELLQVTSDTGVDDSSKVVVFDPATRMFGLVIQLRDGPLWFMGAYGDFAIAVDAM